MPEPKPLQKVLIANRGEIAVRVIRACKDAGIGSVAVYAEPDRDALFVRLADEAYSLERRDAGRLLPRIDKIIAVAEQSGADSVHPGYGFLAENADFAQAVIDAGLIWIGPSPEAIESLGDKAKAKQIALAAGAPLAPGTKDAGQGRRRGRRVRRRSTACRSRSRRSSAAAAAASRSPARSRRSPSSTSPRSARPSAPSAAASAWSRSSSTSRATSRPSAWPTSTATSWSSPPATARCSAATRSWSRRPPRRSSPTTRSSASTSPPRRSCSEAGYVGAGTCEFLVAADGTISFLEVNTRLQVEHCVSEEVTGIDLVREMFRIAAGEELGYDDPEIRGHSIEFRINAEDGGRNFMPAPGTLTAWNPPPGPGVRLDGGYEKGETVPGSFDSLVAKLIVTGRTAPRRIERSRRALDEFVVDGMPTVIPFHRGRRPRPGLGRRVRRRRRGLLRRLHDLDRDRLRQPDQPVRRRRGRGRRGRASGRRSPSRSAASGSRSCCPGGLGGLARRRRGRRRRSRSAAAGKKAGAAASGDAVASPMQGTIVKIAVEEGQEVAEGDVVVVIEAMKMEQPLKAHKAGTITGLQAEVGATVGNGAVLCEIKD